MTGRARNILSRFPAHLEAARAGKRLGAVTEALALDIDTLNVALAQVRRSRRLMEAGEFRDLLRIGALHGIAPAELSVLLTRFAVAKKLLTQAALNDEAAERLIAIWGVAGPAPRLENYEDRATLVPFARRALGHTALLDGVRRRIASIALIHSRGNGTVTALIHGAANALDLDVKSISHSSDRYLHSATVEDRLRLAHPAKEEEKTIEKEFALASERLLIEENPLMLAQTGDIGRKHGELFSVIRRGFERATLQVKITGLENRTIGPMLVNRDEGQGVGFSGAVPSAATIDFTAEGRVLLDSEDVTSLAFSWKGACFAESAALRAADFVFDGSGADPARCARFAESIPAQALAPTFVFPHSGESLPMPGITVGETRFAFFVQEAHFSRLQAGPPETVERVASRPAVGFPDQSLFAPGPSEARPNGAMLSLNWQERQAFSVNVWIPKRFLSFTPEDEEGSEIRARVAFALNRFRPAGVQVKVLFLDDRWVLGRGVVPSEDAGIPDVVGPGSGTDLWSMVNE